MTTTSPSAGPIYEKEPCRGCLFPPTGWRSSGGLCWECISRFVAWRDDNKFPPSKTPAESRVRVDAWLEAGCP